MQPPPLEVGCLSYHRGTRRRAACCQSHKPPRHFSSPVATGSGASSSSSRRSSEEALSESEKASASLHLRDKHLIGRHQLTDAGSGRFLSISHFFVTSELRRGVCPPTARPPAGLFVQQLVVSCSFVPLLKPRLVLFT